MQGANAGNMQNRTPQQQQNMMGPNRTTQQPQNMMGPNRNQQQQPMGANNTMNNSTQQNNMQNNMQNNNMQNNQMQNNMQGGMQNNMQGSMQNNMQQPGMGGPQQQQNMMNQNMRGNMQQTPITTSQSTGLFGSSLFSGPANAAGSMFGGNRAPNPNQMQGQQQGQMGMGQQQQQQQGQMGMGQPGQQGPSMLGGLTSKLGDIASAAPGGDMLSKGKELIFMKFGLGGK